ncbi:MAG: hypothetical protein ACLTG4_04240 [Oscillospiraceae bacterium]
MTEHDHHVARGHALSESGGYAQPVLNRLSGGSGRRSCCPRTSAGADAPAADEPTSNLDIRNQYQVLQITRDLCW